MVRLELTDTSYDVARKMSEGNLGGLGVCMEMLTRGAVIDPDAFNGGFNGMLCLDMLGVYGPHIWILFKDICGQSLPTTMAILRANQLGFISENDVLGAICAAETNQPIMLDVKAAVMQVKERLPAFQLEEGCHEDA